MLQCVLHAETPILVDIQQAAEQVARALRNVVETLRGVQLNSGSLQSPADTWWCCLSAPHGEWQHGTNANAMRSTVHIVQYNSTSLIRLMVSVILPRAPGAAAIMIATRVMPDSVS